MKKIISLLAMFIMMFSLCSCGKNEVVSSVETLIDNLGDIKIESEESVLLAEEAYSLLTDDEKAKVKNIDKLIEARNILDEKLYEELKSSVVGEWVKIGDDNQNYFNLKSDGIASIYTTDGFTWELSKDRKNLIFKGAVETSCEIHNLQGCITIYSPLYKQNFIKKTDYEKIINDIFIQVDINSSNYSDYIGEAIFIKDELNAWGEKTGYGMYAFHSKAYDNGLVFVDVSTDFKMKVIGGVVDYTWNDSPYREIWCGTMNAEDVKIDKIQGKITFIKSDNVSEIYYDEEIQSRIIVLKDGYKINTSYGGHWNGRNGYTYISETNSKF